MIIFSLCYYAERDTVDTAYTSIPQAMWWAIQTLTSVSTVACGQIGTLLGECWYSRMKTAF